MFDGRPAGWIDYSATVALTNINLVNGTVVARYKRDDDNTITVHVVITAGSSTTYSAGNLAVSLPVPSLNTSVVDVAGIAHCDNGTQATRTVCAARFNGGGSVLFEYTGGLVTNTAPFTFGTASHLSFTATYEAA